ncbi:hypothetical protein [Microbacterium sp. K27]|uniref:hypothetical protein n=1 Tax=Microbacterium sp. K27 TaxID=2305445 RepID=UPI00109BB0B2|nr:hypothetical protein [Microbacterium sp. K27]
MSTVPVVRDLKSHIERAAAHKATGERLLELDDEWFAVAFFYSAYHAVKAAMHADPIFDDMKACAAIDGSLTIESRFAEHHSGGFGKGGRTLGVNEIVFKLYKTIRVPYTRLHGASIAVRYGAGLDVISPVTVKDDFEAVCAEYAAGRIVAP